MITSNGAVCSVTVHHRPCNIIVAMIYNSTPTLMKYTKEIMRSIHANIVIDTSTKVKL